MNAQAKVVSPELDRRSVPSVSTTSRSQLSPLARPERVVTLASLSHRIADGYIAEAVAQTLHAETGASVLLVHLQLSEASVTLQDWSRIHPRVNGEFGFNEHLLSAPGNVRTLRLRAAGESPEVSDFAGLVSHFSQHFHYVLIHVSSLVPVPLLMECLAHSGRAFLLLQPTSEDIYHRDLLFREIRAHPRNDNFNLKTIVCRERGEEHFNDLLKQMGASAHGFVHGCPPPSVNAEPGHWHDQHFKDDIRRLAREIARRRVGLALSSGGARGLAHIGVIQVLEENGIEVDVVAGCSMGAYVGAVWAYGCDGQLMEKLAREVEHRWGLFELIDPFILPRQGFLRGEKVKRRLKRSIGDVHFSELVRPLRIVATNLNTLERTVFSSGEVASAVHASAAIPGACAPVNLGGVLYIDGGISDPLPVDVLEEMGIEKIIAVNTIPTPAYLRIREERERDQAEARGRRPSRLKAFVNQYLNYFAPGNILDTIMRSIHGAQMRIAEQSCKHADLVLRPLSFDGRWHDFRHPAKYIAIGRREAEEHLEAIQALVNRKETADELNLAHDAMATAT
jgi:NTE family protein